MSFIKRGAPGLRNRTDRRVTKPPESAPPLAARGACHGIDTDKSAEIEHTWIHADADTRAEETNQTKRRESCKESSKKGKSGGGGGLHGAKASPVASSGPVYVPVLFNKEKKLSFLATAKSTQPHTHNIPLFLSPLHPHSLPPFICLHKPNLFSLPDES